MTNLRIINKSILTALISAAIIGGTNQASADTTPAKSTIYGYKAWSGDPEYTDLGWYQLSADGEGKMLWFDDSDVMPAYFISGWIRNGHLCGIYGNFSAAYHIEYEVETGEFLGLYKIDIDGDNFYRYMYTAAYNPNDDYVYGFSFNSDFSEDYFVRAPATDLNAVEIVRPMPYDYTMCSSVCVNPIDNHLYGTDFLGDFIRIDVNGNFELKNTYGLTDSNDIANWASGICYSPLDNCYFWNRQLNDFSSSWVKIDGSTFEYTKIKELGFLDLYTVLQCLDTDGIPAGPARPSITSHTLTSGANDCSIDFTLPTLDKSGKQLTTALSWTATDRASGVKVTGNGQPGSAATASFSALADGEHTFSIAAATDTAPGESRHINAWIGKDTPAMVRGIKVKPEGDGFVASWEPVVAGAHGGNINEATVSYYLFVGGKQTTSTTETSVSFNLPDDYTEQFFEIAIIAHAEGLFSEPSYLANIEAKSFHELPYSIEPTDNDFATVTIINVDNDNSSWKKSSDLSRNTAFFCNADPNNASDDWLILPALNFATPEHAYEFSMRVSTNSNTKTGEYIEVRIGSEPTPEKMTGVILDRTNVQGTSYKEVSAKFAYAETGKAYIGIHCVSEPKMSGIYLRDINVRETSETGIESNIADNVAVSNVDGGIRVDGNVNATIEVFSTDGRRAASVSPTGKSTFVALNPGFYVVRIGRDIHKIMIKNQ